VAGFNKVILLGNLTRNPELRYTPNGTPVASLGLAVSRRYKQGDELKEEVCFVDIVVFGKQAEHCRWAVAAAPVGNGRRPKAQQARSGRPNSDVHAETPGWRW
jgi:primosomal replication protein N